MTDFLLELRSEEIPARMQRQARADLEKLFRAELDAAGLKPGAVTVWSTPRRLALIARDLPLATEAVSEERKGPRADAPDQALEGFLRSTGLTREQLEVRDVKGKDTFFAVIEKPGRATKDVLAEAIPAVLRNFGWPKSMRWGADSLSSESLRWVRPLSGIVAIFGEELVPCEIGGVASHYDTLGHRFHHHGPITIGGADDYQEKLRACHVIVDHEEREAIIRGGAKAAAEAAGLVLVEDEGLVVENAGLTEYPVPLLGRFDAAFLEVPSEVIQLTARINQKYFVCEENGKLANAFVCTANIDAADGGAAIVAGNEKVLAARLSDAKFFWELDQQKTLEQHAKGLERITFHEKLGTVADKVERVAKLARWLVEEGIVTSSPLPFRGGAGGGGSPGSAANGEVPHPNPSPEAEGGAERQREGLSEEKLAERKRLADWAEQAARLCKADLVTEMVGEFPELQGLMGGYYGEREGLPSEVARAIRDHYKPVGQGDDVPTAPVTVAVSLADKLDTLVGFFGIEQYPTGSKDPFALRRAALAVISLIVRNEVRLTLSGFFAQSLAYIRLSKIENLDVTNIPLFRDYGDRNYGLGIVKGRTQLLYGSKPIVEWTTLPNDRLKESMIIGGMKSVTDGLWDFFADRLKVQQREAGVRHDLIDAVFALGGEDDLVRLLARVKALQSFVETDAGTNLLAAYKRAGNILKQAGDVAAIDSAPTDEPAASVALATALDSAAPQARAAVEVEDFAAAMTALASLRAPIDAFFDHVMVNDEDAARRGYRLSLLARFVAAVHQVADFSRIEG